VPTLLYVILLRIYSKPDYGPIFSGYLGILLVGALFIAIGLFCSSLTKSQIVAAVSTTAILFVGLGLFGERAWASLHFTGASPGAIQVEVTGQQFAWNFRYPGSDQQFS